MQWKLTFVNKLNCLFYKTRYNPLKTCMFGPGCFYRTALHTRERKIICVTVQMENVGKHIEPKKTKEATFCSCETAVY